MARIQDFQDWFTSHYCNRDQFELDAHTFQDVQDATAGWAANGVMYLLNNALSFMDEGEQYLEIGTYGGRSLVGALRNNDKRAQVIDPFLNTAPTVRPAWEKAIDDFGVRDRVTLHETLAENFDFDLPPIGVFFYDGNHDAGHTYEGLKRFEKYLSDEAIIIVDDIMIPGGPDQMPFEGYHPNSLPVKIDVTRWLLESNGQASTLVVTPWTFQQAVICYERKR
jgi:hypothetical protein